MQLFFDYAQNDFKVPPACLLFRGLRPEGEKYLLSLIIILRATGDGRVLRMPELRGWLANRSFGGVRDLIFALGGQTGGECQIISAAQDLDVMLAGESSL